MWFAVVAMLLYLMSLLLIAPMLLRVQTGGHTGKQSKILFFLTALSAIGCHLFSLSDLFVNLFYTQSFSLLDLGSLLSVITAFLATFAIFLRVQTLWFLLPIVYCFAIINLIFKTLVPLSFIRHLAQDMGVLIHIMLALFTYALAFIATLYAIQLAWLEHNLKHKKMTFSSPIVPPLMAVERHFFSLMSSVELLLTLTLISGAIYLADFFAPHNIQKVAFSSLAWFIFGIALFGHWRFYWRGKKMIIYTILGMILLTIAYFGSRVMLGIFTQ